MHTVDVIAVCVAIVVTVVFAAIIARQRYVLRAAGALPLAIRRGNRWSYGIGRYQGGEFRIYRALGIGTRPTNVLRRGQIEVLGRRAPYAAERNTLPSTAVILECRSEGTTVAFALGTSAVTGFVSWLESSAPI